MKKSLSAGVLLLMVTLLADVMESSAQTADEVKWMTFEQAVERSKTEKRKIFIDVYTDWCGWCKVMDKKTFSHSFPRLTDPKGQGNHHSNEDAYGYGNFSIGDGLLHTNLFCQCYAMYENLCFRGLERVSGQKVVQL